MEEFNLGMGFDPYFVRILRKRVITIYLKYMIEFLSNCVKHSEL
jgi:hypothetical protein